MSSSKKCCTLKIKRGHRCIAQVQNREGIASEDDKFVWVCISVVICVQHQIVASIPVNLCVFIPSPNMPKMLLQPTLQHLLSGTDVCLLLKPGSSWTN